MHGFLHLCLNFLDIYGDQQDAHCPSWGLFVTQPELRLKKWYRNVSQTARLQGLVAKYQQQQLNWVVWRNCCLNNLLKKLLHCNCVCIFRDRYPQIQILVEGGFPCNGLSRLSSSWGQCVPYYLLVCALLCPIYLCYCSLLYPNCTVPLVNLVPPPSAPQKVTNQPVPTSQIQKQTQTRICGLNPGSNFSNLGTANNN